ncbi:MAG: YhfG family protein [Pseudomonas protegens]|uniref:YhfG family protein n=1 Tax=Pseudomonas protegens TaxID=380021 RepID=UPI00383AD1B4
MGTISLETKRAYAAKTRKSNYAASLRLEGFKVSPADVERALPSREELLKAFAKTDT